jgi:hypothetical protein
MSIYAFKFFWDPLSGKDAESYLLIAIFFFNFVNGIPQYAWADGLH